MPKIRGGDQIMDDTIDSADIKDGDVGRDDLNTTVAGQAVVTKLIAGTGISLGETGVDSGTGDVTITATGGATADFYDNENIDLINNYYYTELTYTSGRVTAIDSWTDNSKTSTLR